MKKLVIFFLFVVLFTFNIDKVSAEQASGSITIPIGLPDLKALIPISTGQVVPNVPITFSATIQNISANSTIIPFPNAFYLSPDGVTSYQHPATPVQMATLAGGDSDVAYFTHTFTTAQVSSWFIKACADESSSWNPILESNENNNCSEFVPIGGSTLNLSFSAHPIQITLGESSTLSWSSNGSSCVSDDDPALGFDTGGQYTGSDSVTPTQLITTYHITCIGLGQRISGEATVTTLPKKKPGYIEN